MRNKEIGCVFLGSVFLFISLNCQHYFWALGGFCSLPSSGCLAGQNWPTLCLDKTPACGLWGEIWPYVPTWVVHDREGCSRILPRHKVDSSSAGFIVNWNQSIEINPLVSRRSILSCGLGTTSTFGCCCLRLTILMRTSSPVLDSLPLEDPFPVESQIL